MCSATEGEGGERDERARICRTEQKFQTPSSQQHTHKQVNTTGQEEEEEEEEPEEEETAMMTKKKKKEGGEGGQEEEGGGKELKDGGKGASSPSP